MDYPGNLYFFFTQLIVKSGNSGMVIWITTGIILILLLTFISVFYYVENNSFQHKLPVFLKSNWFFLCIASLFILLQRLPSLLSGQLNPDEDLWMAGGATILNDPRFWISFDPTTSGPLVVLPVILVKILGININYTTLRLGALLICIIPSVILLFYSFKNFFNERIARIIVLPFIVCISCFHLKNYIAYNGEHIPLLLTALSIFIYSRIYKTEKLSPVYLYFLLGLALGCFPYSKLQAVPIGLGIALIVIVNLFNESAGNKNELFKKTLFFIGGGLAPSLFVLFYLAISGALNDFWLSFIISNLEYAENGVNGQIGLWMKFKYFIYLLRTMPDSGFYFISLFISSFIALLILLVLKRKGLWENKKMLALPVVILLTSYYGIVKPSNFYEHYMLLFFIPALFFSGTVLGIFQKAFYKAINYFLYIFIVITAIVPYFYYFNTASYGSNTAFLKKEQAAEVISKFTSPGDKMALWGWMTNLYVQTGLSLGTRYGDTYHQIAESKLQSYYIDNYLIDLKRNKPKVFVDVIRPEAYFFNDLKLRHENFSKIDSYIKENYKKAAEVDQIRIYIRN
jgi:hypothetical protein